MTQSNHHQRFPPSALNLVSLSKKYKMMKKKWKNSFEECSHLTGWITTRKGWRSCRIRNSGLRFIFVSPFHFDLPWGRVPTIFIEFLFLIWLCTSNRKFSANKFNVSFPEMNMECKQLFPFSHRSPTHRDILRHLQLPTALIPWTWQLWQRFKVKFR